MSKVEKQQATQPKSMEVPSPRDQPKVEKTEKQTSSKPKTHQPMYDAPYYKGSGKLAHKVAIVTGADSGIGRSVAILFAREGADVVIVYSNKNEEEANTTKSLVEQEGRRSLLLCGDVCDKKFCSEIVKKTIDEFGKIDVLVNNAGVGPVGSPSEELEEVEDFEKSFRMNVLSAVTLSNAAAKQMERGGSIINTTSVASYKECDSVVDYTTTKSAVNAFTKSLAQHLVDRGIRVNGVQPGPIWTPVVSKLPQERLSSFGEETAMGRAGEPEEVAPAFVFLASQVDSSYITGQIIQVNGGTISPSLP